ncbi:MAG: T9SS type A sorting domain-containing protein [Flavobacteriales bacterium]|nr:T9SS type A sorting domain-containing protein [Flavobacteriales bacterium]
MKKILFFLCLSIGVNGFAQISINSTNMPQSGDTLRYSISVLDSAVLSTYQNSGANLTWDFGSLVPRQQEVHEFVSSSQTPYASTVSNRIGLLYADTLSLGGFSIYEAYNFINNTTSDFSIDYRGATAPTGLSFPFPSSIQLVGSYSDKDEIFQFPLSYNDRDSSTFNFVYNNSLLGVYYGSSGYRINEVDAWGSLTTPYGTFNCIRVVTDMVSFDTVSATGQNFGIPSHTREYQWISDQIKIPALKLNGNVIAGAFIPTTIEYRDSVRNIVPILPTIALFTADTTSVEVNKELGFTNFSIGSTSFQWDFTPATITYKSGSSTSRNISVSFQDTGRYDVRLIASGGTDADTLLRSNYIRVTELSVGSKPIVSFGVDTTVVPVGFDYTIYNKTSASANQSYLWTISRPQSHSYTNGTSNTSAGNIVVNFSDTGFYDVKLVAKNDFGADSLFKQNYIFVKSIVGIDEINSRFSNKISIHPNPVSKDESFIIDFKQELTLRSIEVYDIKGSIIQEQNYNNSMSRLSYSTDQSSGVYFMKITTDLGLALKKVVVR